MCKFWPPRKPHSTEVRMIIICMGQSKVQLKYTINILLQELKNNIETEAANTSRQGFCHVSRNKEWPKSQSTII